LYEIIANVRGGAGGDASAVSANERAACPSGQCREERQQLQVCNVLSDITTFIAVADMTGDAFGEIIFEFKSIDLLFLAQKIRPVIYDNVGPGAGVVLR